MLTKHQKKDIESLMYAPARKYYAELGLKKKSSKKKSSKKKSKKKSPASKFRYNAQLWRGLGLW